MTNKLKLSKRGQTFLENLRIYLFSSGKNSDEIEDILNELRDHLLEAEEDGKSIDKIVGKTPKEYMKMISKEMDVDYKNWVKYIILIIVGSFSFTVISDVLKGDLSYSMLEIVGYVLITAIFITMVLIVFKYISTMKKSNIKQGMLFFSVGLLPIALFIGLFYLNSTLDTSIIHFGKTGSLIIGIISILFIIGISIWAKTWVVIIILAFLALPDYLLKLSSLQYETQLILSAVITFGGIGTYFLIVTKLEKSNKG